jgi:hypothetical protein
MKGPKLNGKANGAHQGDPPGADSRTVDDFIKEISACWQKAVASIIQTGHLLISAKKQYPHQFHALIKAKLPFGERAAQKLMRIAAHPILSDPTHVSRLPASWGTLAELTRIPNDKLEKMLAEGTVHAGIERREVEILIDEITEHGVYGWNDASKAIDALIGFKNKWSPKSLAVELTDKNVELPDPSNLMSLSQWLDDFSAACKQVAELDAAEMETWRKKREARDKVNRIRPIGAFRPNPQVADQDHHTD